MKAAALKAYLPISHNDIFHDVILEQHSAQGRDLLVAVLAVSVNPVDIKVRAPKDNAENLRAAHAQIEASRSIGKLVLDGRMELTETPAINNIQSTYSPQSRFIIMNLFTSLTLGKNTLKNRIVMAPMTRSRSAQPGDIPTDLMAEYYAQRASAGLIVTEATQISPQGKGYSFTPGIYSEAQINGWRTVTDAVHKNNGVIFSQLWHVGRMSTPVFHNGDLPVAPSAIAFDGSVWVFDEQEQRGKSTPCPTPRALTYAEIKAIVADYAQAAANAIKAGFDGVEIHGANGYLIDQFLRTTSNLRTDEYGGSQANRLRFLQEVVKAIVEEVGAERVGIRLAPFITARGMACPEILDTILKAADFLQKKGIAYIHLAEADWDDAPTVTEDFRRNLRAQFKGVIIVAGKFNKARANEILTQDYADLVAFGRLFVANPDLPLRLEKSFPLANLEKSTLFGGNAEGYTDYPQHSA